MNGKKIENRPFRERWAGRIGTLIALAALPFAAACAPEGMQTFNSGQLYPNCSAGTPGMKARIPENYSRSLDLPRADACVLVRIELPKVEGTGALNLGRLSDVSRVRLNGEEIGSRGRFEPYEPGSMRTLLLFVGPEAQKKEGNELTIELSTRDGRYQLQLVDPVRWGPAGVVVWDHIVSEIIANGFLIIYCMVAFYHLFLMYKRPEEDYHLYFALFAFVTSAYWFVAETFVRENIFQQHVELRRRIEYSLVYFIAPLFVMFLNRYFYRRHDWVGFLLLAEALVLTLVSTLGDVHAIRDALTFWQYSFVISSPLFFFYIFRRFLFRRRESVYLAAGMLLLFGGGVYDILAAMDVIRSVRISSYTLLVFVLGMEALLSNRFVNALRNLEQALARTTRLSLELIRKNIHPHFLMNSINSAIGLAHESPDAAVELLGALSGELRATIAMSEKELTFLETEIELCRNHLKLMGLRKERKFEFQVDGEPRGILLPPLILLTLVENGLTHGFRRRPKGRFLLTIQSGDGRVGLHLWNDGEPSPGEKKGTGTGLRYVESRLQEAFPDEWKLSSGPADGGWLALVSFPAR